MEERSLWVLDTDPEILGLPSVAQVVRIDRHRQELRRGVVTRDSTESHYAAYLIFDNVTADILIKIAVTIGILSINPNVNQRTDFFLQSHFL